MNDMRQWTLNITGGLIGVGLISLLAYATHALINTEVPSPNRDALLIVLGILSMNVATIINFYFGASVTSKKQSETIDTLAKAAQAASAAINTPDNAMVIPTGGTATATATPDGTVIEKETPK